MRALLLVAAALAFATAALAVDITTCGQTVPNGGVGTVQADLSCTGAFVGGVGFGGTLYLNGHTLSTPSTSSGTDGVRCQSDCGVQGPGTVRRAFNGVTTASGLRMVLTDVVVDQCAQGVLANSRTKIHVTD